MKTPKPRLAEKLIITVNTRKNRGLSDVDNYKTMLRYGNGPKQYIESSAETLHQAVDFALDVYLDKHHQEEEE